MTFHARGLSPEQVAQAVRDATGGGIHVSIDALGRGFTVNQSIHSLRKHGRHVQVGLTSQEERGQVAIPVDNLVTGEWEVVGSKGNPHPNYDESAARRARKAGPGAARHAPDCARGRDGQLQRVTRFETVGFEVITRYA